MGGCRRPPRGLHWILLHHALIRENQGERIVAQRQLFDRFDRLLASGGANDAVVAGEMGPQIPLYCVENPGLIVDGEYDGTCFGHITITSSSKQYLQDSPGSIDVTRGWLCCSQCPRACRFLELSQQPTCPQSRQDRRWTQVSPMATHWSQPVDPGSATIVRFPGGHRFGGS